MTTCWLIRHGQTDNNRAMRFTGHEDLPLTDEGHVQARALADKLKGERITSILGGPLRRVRETALPLAASMGLALDVDAAFDDVHVGAWQGKTVDELRRSDEARFLRWVEHPESFTFPGGESVPAVQRRAVEGLCRRLKELGPADGGLVVVTHQIVVKVLLLHADRRSLADFWHLRVEPGSLLRLDLVATGDGFCRVAGC